MVGLVTLTLLCLIVFVGPLIYTTSIDQVDLSARLQPPSPAHPMGTDRVGQDLMARVLVGGRISLIIGLMAALVALVIGTLIGAAAGYRGGMLDSTLMRSTDLFFALPTLPVLLVVIYAFRDPIQAAVGAQTGMFILTVLIIGSLSWMSVARLVRAEFLSIREQEYIEACRCIGVPWRRQIIRQMLPNALGPIIVATSIGVAGAILIESTLSFLGLGFPPDVPTWGRLLYEARDRLDVAPYLAIFPGLMIFLAILSINFIGDGLDEALDPKRSR
jgi:peptide/nickel transport system permease protein